MNPMADSSILANQGILFWLACGAVALGLTMLVTAVVVQVRRLAQRHPPADVSHPGPVVAKREVENAYARVEPTEKPAIPRLKRRERGTRDTDRLVVLLSRLEDAAARLETVATRRPESAQVENPQSPGDSALKEETAGVEYVFRAAGG